MNMLLARKIDVAEDFALKAQVVKTQEKQERGISDFQTDLSFLSYYAERLTV